MLGFLPPYLSPWAWQVSALAGCSSASAPSWLQTTPPPPPTQTLQFESQPAGADVHTDRGQTCRTPCSLAVPVTSQSVDFALNGYTPQTIQVSVHEPEHSLFSSPPPDLVPNPVRAILQAAPPPAPQNREAEIAKRRGETPAGYASTAIDRRSRAPVGTDAGQRLSATPASGLPLALPCTAGDAVNRRLPAGTFPERFWTIRALSGTIAAYLKWRWTACNPWNLDRRTRAPGTRRSVRPRHYLSPRLGHRSMRFPLCLLHGGKHVLSA